MRGYCKCDLCGNIYNESDNPVYDGITVWWKNRNGENEFPMSGSVLSSEDGNHTTTIPAILDVCPSCFEKFYNWVRKSCLYGSRITDRKKAESKSDGDFPMNKPE